MIKKSSPKIPRSGTLPKATPWQDFKEGARFFPKAAGAGVIAGFITTASEVQWDWMGSEIDDNEALLTGGVVGIGATLALYGVRHVVKHRQNVRKLKEHRAKVEAERAAAQAAMARIEGVGDAATVAALEGPQSPAVGRASVSAGPLGPEAPVPLPAPVAPELPWIERAVRSIIPGNH